MKTSWGFLGVRPRWADRVWERKLEQIREVKRAISGSAARWVAVAIAIAFYLLLAVAVFGKQSGNNHRSACIRNRPPRLFVNGEVARIAATGKKVVVMAARWERGEWVYFCLPK